MRKRTVARTAVVVLVGGMALSLAGCATSINRIMADPSYYHNRETKVSGRVVDSVSLGPRGAYLLEDRTGQLWVLSERGVPRRGARVKVTGTVLDGYNLGSLANRLKLPRGLDSGVVLIEDSHSRRW